MTEQVHEPCGYAYGSQGCVRFHESAGWEVPGILHVYRSISERLRVTYNSPLDEFYIEIGSRTSGPFGHTEGVRGQSLRTEDAIKMAKLILAHAPMRAEPIPEPDVERAVGRIAARRSHRTRAIDDAAVAIGHLLPGDADTETRVLAVLAVADWILGNLNTTEGGETP